MNIFMNQGNVIKRLTYVNELDAVLLYGIEGDGDVLEGVRL